MGISIVILAAGMGKRMKSSLPKVLHPLAGKPLLGHVVAAAQTLNPNKVITVYGHGGDQVLERMKNAEVSWVEQTQLLGTGDAVARAIPSIPEDDMVLILYGDVPLTKTETLTRLMLACDPESIGLLTVELNNPTGYGRIVRNKEGFIERIVEEKDATAAEKCINEINTGLMCVQCADLKRWLANLNNDNAQGEYYLTDIIEMAVSEGKRIHAVHPESRYEVEGVNDRFQLSVLEREYQLKMAQQFQRDGLYISDASRFDIRGSLTFGQDCSMDVNVIIEGLVTLGDNVSIGANCVIKDADIGDNVTILPNSVIDEANVGAGSKIGPFARLRPGAELSDHVHIGNFVEIKKSTVGSGSKVNHLTYIGDSEIGCDTNIGAGTITCNYDGVNKHKTTIGDRVFVGSDTQFIAPVTIGDDATIAAGSTISRDAPAGQLTLTRSPQKSLSKWKKPTKKPECRIK